MVWSGYMPLLVFRHITGKAIYVIRSNSALLYHSQVTPFDIFVGRCGLEAMGSITALVSSFLVLYFLGFLDWPLDPMLFIAGNLYMVWWSLAIAMIVAAWSERTEMVEHVWQVISYMYMPVSGFWFLAEWLPASVRGLALAVMPSLHSYEMIRFAMLGHRIQPFYDIPYVTYFLVVLTVIGLWLMRGIRRHLEVVE